MVWRTAPPLVRLLGRLLFSIRVERAAVPDGPVVFAVNHFSHLDPVVAGLAAERPVRFLAVDELFGRSKLFDRLTLWLGAIPMTRTRIPFGPLKLALAELAAGTSIGVFPEGVRVWAWGERAPKRGAAWLAHRAGVPLVPIAIEGTDNAMGRGSRWISRAPVTVTVCDAIHPADHADADDPVGSMSEEWSLRVGAVVSSS
jgi:1-acyl-sn-glycerol-3-phosphate acyltransferase